MAELEFLRVTSREAPGWVTVGERDEYEPWIEWHLHWRSDTDYHALFIEDEELAKRVGLALRASDSTRAAVERAIREDSGRAPEILLAVASLAQGWGNSEGGG